MDLRRLVRTIPVKAHRLGGAWVRSVALVPDGGPPREHEAWGSRPVAAFDWRIAAACRSARGMARGIGSAIGVTDEDRRGAPNTSVGVPAE